MRGFERRLSDVEEALDIEDDAACHCEPGLGTGWRFEDPGEWRGEPNDDLDLVCPTCGKQRALWAIEEVDWRPEEPTERIGQ